MMQLLLTRGEVDRSVAGKLKCLNAEHPDQPVKDVLDELAPGDMPACSAENQRSASRTGSSGRSDTLRCYVSTMLVYRTGRSAPAGSIVPLAPVSYTLVPLIVTVSIGPELETT